MLQLPKGIGISDEDAYIAQQCRAQRFMLMPTVAYTLTRLWVVTESVVTLQQTACTADCKYRLCA